MNPELDQHRTTVLEFWIDGRNPRTSENSSVCQAKK